MRIFEVTNPEEQLGLLKLIIDSTWSAIQKQADEQRAIDATKNLQSKLKAGRTVTPKLRPKQMPPVKTSADNVASDKDNNELDDGSDNEANTDAEQDELALDSQIKSSINSKPSSTNNSQNF